MPKPNSDDDQATIYHLTASHDGQTVASALRQLMGGASWNEVRNALSNRRVQVNGNLCLDEARRVTAKDVIKVWKRSLPKPVASDDVKIVYADPFLVVVEKPAGVTSVRHFEERNISDRRRQLQPTLDELLPDALQRYRNRNQSFDERTRRKPKQVELPSKAFRSSNQKKNNKPTVIAVHRLDRDTSGLMLFACDSTTAAALNRMFKKHTIDRRYQAVVLGDFQPATFDSYLVRDRGDGIRGSAQGDIPDDAQRAITHAKPIERIGDYTVVECKLQTGRTHQIRIHLSEAGHMLCGEAIYNRSVNGERVKDSSNAPRHALHSCSLQFIHPRTQESMSFKMPWPADLQRWLTDLRKRYAAT
jgi:23S rRNA pseudouridine1911/1915/1917 synthase